MFADLKVIALFIILECKTYPLHNLPFLTTAQWNELNCRYFRPRDRILYDYHILLNKRELLPFMTIPKNPVIIGVPRRFRTKHR